MKLTAEREKLLSPLQAVIGVVERRQTMPVLANVLLGVRQGQLSITATDLEVELVASTEVAGLKAGRNPLSRPESPGTFRVMAAESSDAVVVFGGEVVIK